MLDPGVPTPERLQHGDIVERLEKPIADDDGRPARPYWAGGLLAVLERRGVITKDQRTTGEAFQATFRAAQFVQLKSAALIRASRQTKAKEAAKTTENARDDVWRAICLAGGLASPAGSCLWLVIGWELPIDRWALEQSWHGRSSGTATALQILRDALALLEQKWERQR
jgi:hypothetical protein